MADIAFGLYGQMLYVIAFSLLESHQDAEDAVQVVFEKLLHNRRPVRKGIEEVKAWLIVCTENHCKDVLKSAWRKRVQPLDERHEPASDEHERHDGDLPEELHAAVASLPRSLRVCVVLRYIEGYEPHEIATLLHLTPETVRYRLFRARRIIRRALEER